MKRSNVLFLGILIALLITACAEKQGHNNPLDPLNPVNLESTNTTIIIGSFNIQNFGESKSSDEAEMAVLAKVITNFDIVAIQEIESGGMGMPLLKERVNEIAEAPYEYVMSVQTGDEYYAYMFRNDKVAYDMGSAFVYDDLSAEFSRPPYLARFIAGTFTFVLATIHTRPDDATSEINALTNVINAALTAFSAEGEKDIIVLGDYNADGSYYNENTIAGLKSEEYYWVIDNNLDTTVALGNNNTYDRIVYLDEYTDEDFLGQYGALRFDEVYAEDFAGELAGADVSDHYPIWAVFSILNDTDGNASLAAPLLMP